MKMKDLSMLLTTDGKASDLSLEKLNSSRKVSNTPKNSGFLSLSVHKSS